MRPDKPLPGDFVLRCRVDHTGFRRVDVWVMTYWPNGEDVVAGPYQSYSYAFQQAQKRARDPLDRIWRDHAKSGDPEKLELVGGGAA